MNSNFLTLWLTLPHAFAVTFIFFFLLEHFRMSQVCLHMQSDQLWKAVTCFSVCLQKQKWSIKLYMLPFRAIAGHHVLKPFASVGSLEADLSSQENHAPGVSAPNNIQRWDNSSTCNYLSKNSSTCNRFLL